MDNRKYLTMDSFWMFLAGLAVGMMVIMAVLLSRNAEVGDDGQTRLLRGGNVNKVTPQESVSGVNPSFKTGQVSGVNPSFTTGTGQASGVNPSFTNGAGQVSGVNPSF